MDSMRPSKVTPQNQAPPPYYPCSGMENKALEHSMTLSMDDSKSPRYGSTGGYAYHVPPHTQTHPGQTMPNSDCKYTLKQIRAEISTLFLMIRLSY